METNPEDLPCLRPTLSKEKLLTLNVKNLKIVERYQEKFEKTLKERRTQLKPTFDYIPDPYEVAHECKNVVRKETCYSLDMSVNDHKCTWDPKYPENPERLNAVVDRLNELGLLQRCKKLEKHMYDENYLKTIHTPPLVDRLKNICQEEEADMEKTASEYDAIYFNKSTFDAAVLAASQAIETVLQVASGNYHNGIALIRPPGHHASSNEYNGYCYFNNVAVAADMAIKNQIVKRILIVDIDIHHGQGTQRAFYDRKDVLYFSIHRWEYGKFWPNLREGSSRFIGEGQGMGHNVNVPLNDVGLGDAEYMAIVHNVLLPIAYEYQPELVIVSAGYDAAVGCPEGEMKVTPAFYGHLISLLSGLANGKVVVCLEGGYFLPSLAEGVAETVRALLGDPCPMLEPYHSIHPSVIETILNTQYFLKYSWEPFFSIESHEFPPKGEDLESLKQAVFDPLKQHLVTDRYFGEPGKAPYETRNCYPMRSEAEDSFFDHQVKALKIKYERPAKKGVGYVYDEFFMRHEPWDPDAVKRLAERPTRILDIHKLLKEFKLFERMKKIEIIDATIEQVKKTHDSAYVDMILSFTGAEKGPDIYSNGYTPLVMLKAAGGLTSLADAILKTKEIDCGVAIVRPPGHHAANEISGFCYINNAVICADYVIDTYNKKRVLIVDFDIHHGNGTQDLTYNRKDILYISAHRFENASFYPKLNKADYDYIGTEMGEGYNINIPLNYGKMNHNAYFKIFHKIILPIAYSFAPDFLIISGGFDASVNDPLGNGFQLHPEMFGQMVMMLKNLAGGQLILALEGGYNATATAYSMMMSVKALLGDPIPTPSLVDNTPKPIYDTIRDVINTHRIYWPVLQVNKSLSRFVLKDEDIVKIRDILVRVRRYILLHPRSPAPLPLGPAGAAPASDRSISAVLDDLMQSAMALEEQRQLDFSSYWPSQEN